mmetsp:Transcript_4738/g.11163  ORF Transcript_4738/g.11163 Transcript_4738/m.11163 type:complete len:267 (-) Transcript_4738:564-1364(-)
MRLFCCLWRDGEPQRSQMKQLAAFANRNVVESLTPGQEVCCVFPTLKAFLVSLVRPVDVVDGVGLDVANAAVRVEVVHERRGCALPFARRVASAQQARYRPEHAGLLVLGPGRAPPKVLATVLSVDTRQRGGFQHALDDPVSDVPHLHAAGGASLVREAVHAPAADRVPVAAHHHLVLVDHHADRALEDGEQVARDLGRSDGVRAVVAAHLCLLHSVECGNVAHIVGSETQPFRIPSAVEARGRVALTTQITVFCRGGGDALAARG